MDILTAKDYVSCPPKDKIHLPLSGLFKKALMQGPLNRWKLGSYEVKKFGEAEPNDGSLLLQASKLLNFAPSL
jgi:hypothetical protein